MISKIEFSDLPDLAALYKKLVDKQTDIEKMQKSFQRIEMDSNYWVLGARNQGRLVGSAMGIICHDLVGACRPFMVIENVIVKGDSRNQGVGKRLMSALEHQAICRECYYAILVSSNNQHLAHDFYTANGYDSKTYRGFKKYFPRHQARERHPDSSLPLK